MLFRIRLGWFPDILRQLSTWHVTRLSGKWMNETCLMEIDSRMGTTNNFLVMHLGLDDPGK